MEAADRVRDLGGAPHVPLVVADHEAHVPTWAALHARKLGLAGHAWFETFSVLTRLPGAARRDAPTVVRLISANFPHSRFLDEGSTASLTSELGALGVSGGAVYDALVAAAAAHHKRGGAVPLRCDHSASCRLAPGAHRPSIGPPIDTRR